jgi:hypothetical protein
MSLIWFIWAISLLHMVYFFWTIPCWLQPAGQQFLRQCISAAVVVARVPVAKGKATTPELHMPLRPARGLR